jgi:drug/metabolite transporter (DMT)-like permease
MPPRARVALSAGALTAVAMVAFAANSLLARAALRPRLADAATFTLVRLASGALLLWLLAAREKPAGGSILGAGNNAAAASLFAYALAFSWAYLRLEAGTGALLMFGTVQVTMIGAGLVAGHRLAWPEWLGLVVALAGLVALTAPGLTAPDPTAATIMVVAGVAWGAYSLLGRGVLGPLASNASNFARSVPLALLALALLRSDAHATARGLALATVSGAITSGLGYAIWYAALRGLTPARASIVQLAVPVLAALGGVLTLGETITPRLLLSSALVLGGIALAIAGRGRPRAAAAIAARPAART